MSPRPGVALSAIVVPSATRCEQSVCPAPPQSMPLPVTVPDPVPEVVTVSVLVDQVRTRRCRKAHPPERAC
jgi:hypothetical protein